MKLNMTELIDKQYGLSPLPDETAYAMAYVPFQGNSAKLFSPDHGFVSGTMYKDLNKPFFGSKCGDDVD